MHRTFEPAERRGDGRSLRVRVLVAVSLLVASLLASALTAPAAGASGAAGAAPVVGCVAGSHVAGNAYHYGLNDPLRYADPSGASAEVGRGGVSDAALVAGSWPDGIVDGLASLPGLFGDNLSSLLDTGAALLGDCRLLPKITWRPAMGPDVGCIAGNAGELISSALDGLLASIDEVVNAGSGPQAALAALSAVMGFDLGDCYDKGWQYCIAKGAVPFLAEALITGGTGKIASSVAKVLDHLPTPNLPGGGHGHTGTPRRTGGTPRGAPGGGGQTVRHYTTPEAAEQIAKSGQIRPGLESGKIWVTPDKYADGATAQARLALDKTPGGYFEIPVCRVRCPSPPSTVRPTTKQPGGGIEITTTSPIDITDLPFIPFRPR